jgi:hypothetical protein
VLAGALLVGAHGAGAATAMRASDDSFSVLTAPTYADGNVLTNDTDSAGNVAQGSPLVVVNTSVVRNPAHGSVYLQSDGYFQYVPGAASGSCPGPVQDFFVYEIADSTNPAIKAQATVRISWAQTSPAVANPDALDASAGAALTVDVAANDCAGDGAPDYGSNYVILWNSQPGKGQLVHNYAGVYTYIPDAGATGTDSFDYVVQNPSLGTAGSSRATVSITLPAPPAPVVAPAAPVVAATTAPPAAASVLAAGAAVLTASGVQPVAGPELANTGAAHAGAESGLGAVLVLVGAGAVWLGRRPRRVPEPR